MTMKAILTKLFSGNDLSESEAYSTMNSLMTGQVSAEEVGAFLGSLRTKGETVEEIVGCAKSLREHSVPLSLKRTDTIDTCGTGGDGANTFNISTTTAFIGAAAGFAVCKHGNRSISSQCGSADVLEALEIPIDFGPDQAAKALEQVGYCFLFAPKYHPAMGNVAPIRRNLGARTIFNLLGPLANPAQTKRQVIGVYDRSKLLPFAEVLKNLGSENVLLVTGDDGLDEITTTTTTQAVHLRAGTITELTIDPDSYGIKRAKAEDLVGGDKSTNAEIIKAILRGQERGAKRDIVLINAAAALLVMEKVDDLKDGIEEARRLLESGEAWTAFENIRSFVP